MKSYKFVQGICLAISLSVAAVLTGWLAVERGMLVEARGRAAEEKLAQEVLRFHVLANSDSSEDQKVKMQVKESVISYLEEALKGQKTRKATKEYVEEHLESIRILAEETVRKAGSDASVTAELVTDEFPEKHYGDVTFPAGTYEALRIIIGEGEGHNWWCCLYPKLCFIDAVQAKVPEEGKESLAQVLDEDAYDMITSTTNIKIRWFFFEKD